MLEKKLCPVCGDIIRGRIDKKFCSDLCRNSFNNQLNTYTNNYIRQVNNVLRRNRRILSELNTSGKSKTSLSKLVEKGFDFKYFTSIHQTNSGNSYHFCYEQGYMKLENNLYALLKKSE
jgi:hypothetical protein